MTPVIFITAPVMAVRVITGPVITGPVITGLVITGLVITSTGLILHAAMDQRYRSGGALVACGAVAFHPFGSNSV